MKTLNARVNSEINSSMMFKRSDVCIDFLLSGDSSVKLNFKHFDFCPSFDGQAGTLDHRRHDLQLLQHEYLQFLFSTADGFHVL